MDRACDVRAIAVHRPAKVENDGVALRDPAVAGLVVRRGSVRARRDDGESDLVVALRAKELRQVRTDLALGPTGEGALEDPERSEEHTSELQSHVNLVCRLL